MIFYVCLGKICCDFVWMVIIIDFMFVVFILCLLVIYNIYCSFYCVDFLCVELDKKFIVFDFCINLWIDMKDICFLWLYMKFVGV